MVKTKLHVQPKAAPVPSFMPVRRGVLQRKCACGGTPGPSGECGACRKKKLQRKSHHPELERNDSAVPAIVHEVLRSPGQPLDPQTRALMEPRFGHDFGSVRVHADAKAAESARAVNAAAYTVGRDIAFASGNFQPGTRSGRHLVAHELAHVVQQQGASSSSSLHGLTIDDSHGALETEAKNIAASVANNASIAPHAASRAPAHAATTILSRADPDAVGHTMGLGRAARTGIQFFPTNVTDTRVGPVTARGGLLSGGASRLNVIIAADLTPRALAAELLPLWITATPFTPPSAAAPLPLDIITADELSRGLLVIIKPISQSRP
jgi:hypothetical protein